MTAKNKKTDFLKFFRVSLKHECWQWFGVKHLNGYGRFRFNGKYYLAHRFSWEFYKGEIPEKLDVCHTCDNPSCVNPSHLFLGTHQQNMQDRTQKERQAKGELIGNSKLTEEDIILIKDLYQRYKIPHSKLAKMFQVNKSGISRIINKQMWKHIK